LCKKTGKKIAGGAWQLSTAAAVTAKSQVNRLRRIREAANSEKWVIRNLRLVMWDTFERILRAKKKVLVGGVRVVGDPVIRKSELANPSIKRAAS
jgi:hypothetical protein